MHFRHFLLVGLVAVTAIILPDIAFAEKNTTSKSTHSPNAAVQSVTAKMADPTGNAAIKNKGKKPVIKPAASPKQTSQSPGLKKQQRKAVSSLKAASKKPPAAADQRPVQKQTNKNAILKKSSAAIASKKAAAGQPIRKAGQEPDTNSKKETGDSVESSLNSEEMAADKKAQSLRFIDSTQSYAAKSERESTSLKGTTSEPDRKAPEEEREVPVGKDKFPIANQASTLTQRTNHTSGSSSDRASNSSGSINPVDIWFKWSQFYNIQLTQTYFSRQALFTNQWVNAPPAPPPKEALFL